LSVLLNLRENCSLSGLHITGKENGSTHDDDKQEEEELDEAQQEVAKLEEATLGNDIL
jgi:hypothetical protein